MRRFLCYVNRDCELNDVIMHEFMYSSIVR